MRRLCWASLGSLRRPAVPNRKMGVLSHCLPGTTASAHSSKGPSALLYSPVQRSLCQAITGYAAEGVTKLVVTAVWCPRGALSDLITMVLCAGARQQCLGLGLG